MKISDLRKQLNSYNIEDISHCSCGAYTVTINGVAYSVHEDNFFKHFPNIDKKLFKAKINKVLMNSYYNCSHCVNNWGLDICACGSGEPYNECNEGFDECGVPMQSIELEYNHVRGGGSWV